MNNTKFDKGLEGLRQVELAPEKKGAIFNTLSRYVEAHPAVTNEHYFAALQRMLQSIFTTISWK